MSTNAPDPVPDADPRLRLRERLLHLGGALGLMRGTLDGHRQALVSFAQYDSYSGYAMSLVALLEGTERNLDHLVRACASFGVKLAEQALEDALRDAPELDAGEGPKS